MSDPTRFTRGTGLLEPLLARLRAKKANQLIPDGLRNGRILDIGCGSFPYFLSHTYFKKKYAIESSANAAGVEGINWFSLDLNNISRLPFEDSFFSTITLLAVIEHLDPTGLTTLLQECHRVLAPEGILIITTPSAWSDLILKNMANLSLVSKEEIDEHVFAYTLPLMGWYFGKAGFELRKVSFGYFELMMNMWATARK
jgi:SAM-dependent methyltransferase